MPKPKRITIVSLDKPQDNVNNAELVSEDITVSQENTHEPIEESYDTSTQEPINKAKPKRKPRSKKQEESTPQPEINVITTLDESVADVVVPDITTTHSKTKVSQKIKCPDCGKMISEKTYKYTHVHNCKSKKEMNKHQEVENQQSINDETETKEEQTNNNYQYQSIEVTLPPPKPIRVETQRDIRNRMKVEKIKALIANAF